METALKSYKKEMDYSYSFGAFPTFELVKARPESVIKVLVSPDYHEEGGESLLSLCADKGVEVEQNGRLVTRLARKENCFVIGVFKKYVCKIDGKKSHIALVNPGNMGNMGTIIRTMLGFGIEDLALLEGGVDIADPKVVRASMGAIFRIRYQRFDSMEEYLSQFGGRDIYTFMLNGETPLDKISRGSVPFSLVFGNEATGLSDKYHELGQSVVIRHSGDIDSLNLSIAAGMAIYEFTRQK